MPRKPRPSRGWRKEVIHDGQCDRCGWPADGDPMWARDESGELACSVSCSRWLDDQRARVEGHYRERRESEERMERGFRLAREARALEGRKGGPQ